VPDIAVETFVLQKEFEASLILIAFKLGCFHGPSACVLPLHRGWQ
jgi:hypothetical protein